MIFTTLYFCVFLLMARHVDGFVGVEFSWKRATSPLSSNAIPSASRRISSSPFYYVDVFQSPSSTSYNQDNFIKQNSSDDHRTIDDPDLPVGYNRHSASDWLYNVRSIPQSSVLREVRSPVLTVAAWSLAVSVIQKMLSCSTAPGLQSLARKMCITGAAHSFLVSALSLLLVFRTNSSYQKFNVSWSFLLLFWAQNCSWKISQLPIPIFATQQEGRKIWENILSVSRNLSRMLRLYSKDVGTDRKRRILNLVAAYPYLLRHHIRSGCLCENRDDEALSDIEEIYRLQLQEPSVIPVETRHEGDNAFRKNNRSADQRLQLSCWVDRRNFPWCLFDRRSLPKVAAAHNRPLWVCDRIGQEIVSIPYTPNFTSRERLALLGQVEKLTNAVGQCERIHKTAVPLNYARHSLRGLALWSLTLPFATPSTISSALLLPRFSKSTGSWSVCNSLVSGVLGSG